MATRCDPDNAKALCNTCHRKWHSNPVDATEWLRGVIGVGRYDRLRLKANKPTKMTTFDKDFIRKEQQEWIKMLEAGTCDIPAFNRKR